VQELFKHVPVLDTGARGSTITFVNNGQGDVLLAWENEAFLALKEDGGADKFDIVVPSLSILAEPPVAVVDKNAEKKGNDQIAEEYLKHLYSPAGQKIAAENSTVRVTRKSPPSPPAVPETGPGDHRQGLRWLEDCAAEVLQ
jgi:sulfate transport system substrate-binding protein